MGISLLGIFRPGMTRSYRFVSFHRRSRIRIQTSRPEKIPTLVAASIRQKMHDGMFKTAENRQEKPPVIARRRFIPGAKNTMPVQKARPEGGHASPAEAAAADE